MSIIECGGRVKWQPKEIIDLGNGCKIGISSHDDYYRIFLLDCNGSWEPTNWIPARAAKRLGELATFKLSMSDTLH